MPPLFILSVPTLYTMKLVKPKNMFQDGTEIFVDYDLHSDAAYVLRFCLPHCGTSLLTRSESSHVCDATSHAVGIAMGSPQRYGSRKESKLG